MRILKVFLSLCLIGGLLFIGYYGVSTWQSDRLHDSLSSAVEEARRTTTPTATAAATATAARMVHAGAVIVYNPFISVSSSVQISPLYCHRKARKGVFHTP